MKTARLAICCALIVWGQTVLAGEPKFERQTIDGDIKIGYGLALGRVDADKHVDILLADKNEIVWYENPGDAGQPWKKHVIARDLTNRDNVCLAARDLDGDGLVEIAVGADWNPRETSDPKTSGALFFLRRPQDPTRPWKVVPIESHEPTTHRMHWLRGAEGTFLAVLPLHGVGNASGEGKNVFISLYDVSGDKPRLRKRIDSTMHMTHNFEVFTDPELGSDECLLVAGKEGYVVVQANGETTSLVDSQLSKGAGEVRRYPIPDRVFVGIEPMHGTDVVVYRFVEDGVWKKKVLDTSLAEGHAIAAGDLVGSKSPDLVAGWRSRDQQGKVGLRLYEAVGDGWKTHVLDDNHTACEDVKLADLDGDGKLDVLAAGRSSHNVVVYWNRSN